MMRRSFFTLAAAAAAAVLMSASGAHASTSTAIFQTTGPNTSLSGTTYTLTGWSFTAGNGTNDFASPSYVSANFGDTSFNYAGSGSGIISFSDAGFGSFSSTSIIVEGTLGSTTQYLVYGNWTPGTDSTAPVAQPGSLAISVTNNGGTLTAQGVMSVPPVPEPSSVVLGLASLAIGGLAHGVRRRRAGK